MLGNNKLLPIGFGDLILDFYFLIILLSFINLIITLVKILEKANKIILALSALIPIIITILDKAISILEDYKAQLLNINGILEKASADGTNPSLLNTNGANGDGSNYGEVQTGYKGFKFAIREDNSFGVHVGQYKRHYAVAIDKYNVDVLNVPPLYDLAAPAFEIPPPAILSSLLSIFNAILKLIMCNNNH
jgi:hypothetical protein